MLLMHLCPDLVRRHSFRDAHNKDLQMLVYIWIWLKCNDLHWFNSSKVWQIAWDSRLYIKVSVLYIAGLYRRYLTAKSPKLSADLSCIPVIFFMPCDSNTALTCPPRPPAASCRRWSPCPGPVWRPAAPGTRWAAAACTPSARPSRAPWCPAVGGTCPGRWTACPPARGCAPQRQTPAGGCKNRAWVTGSSSPDHLCCSALQHSVKFSCKTTDRTWSFNVDI